MWGLSYGGFFTLEAMTRTPSLFRCGVDVAGTIDYRMYYGDPYRNGWTVGRMGTPEENPGPYDVAAPIDRLDAEVQPGATYRVDVVVRTRKIGHFFPGGTVDAFDVWLEFQATDENGHTLFWSGMVEDNGKGPVEKSAHFYRSLQVDGNANPINKRNAWAARAVLYARLIPPGAADTFGRARALAQLRLPASQVIDPSCMCGAMATACALSSSDTVRRYANGACAPATCAG